MKERQFKISSTHDVNEDSYQDGELQSVNFYTLDATIKTSNGVMDAIEKYFENTLYYKFDKNISVNDNKFTYDVLVDNDNVEVLASEIQFEEWKHGKKVLYNNYIVITVEEVVSVDLSKELEGVTDV